MKKKGQISNYSEFVATLNNNLNQCLEKPKSEWKELAMRNVDGLASDQLRELVSLEKRREGGIFFTDSLLAKKVFEGLQPIFNENSKIYDPACGAGNLLISIFDYLRIKKIGFRKGISFYGTDIHNEFVEATKLRFTINQLLHSTAIEKNAKIATAITAKKVDGLKSNEFYKLATHIVVNPPFNLIEPSEKITWSSGQVSAAALFMDKVVHNVNPGVSICAILPDVLRSGSRYDKWRMLMTKHCYIEKLNLLGQFDKFADVDVFSIRMTKRTTPLKTGKNTLESHENVYKEQTISDLFDVCVGPVVDNRDPKKGETRNFIISKGLEGWTKQTKFSLSRAHQGRSFKSPFVVIKRTSRMGDSQRAIATIINSKKKVFVDNHLIVLTPKKGTLAECKLIVENLKKNETDRWLNKKIRCRHLTVKIVSKIPIWTYNPIA